MQVNFCTGPYDLKHIARPKLVRRNVLLAKHHADLQHVGMFGPSRHHAFVIWKAAVAAVDSEQLVRNCVTVEADTLYISGRQVSLVDVGHIEIVGAGKAGPGMARGVEQALADLPPRISRSGWINVPDDCVEPLKQITLHGARPPGINEPTQAGVDGTTEILRRVSERNRNDLCLVLISGGGSALLPAPVSQISLADKLSVTRFLSAAGATIQELNAVRCRISAVKNGGLARACAAGHLCALIISDVIGDPLDVIASGPTCTTDTATSLPPLEVLQKFDPDLRHTPPAVIQVLREPVNHDPPSCLVENHIIGNNQLAVSAAAKSAVALGYQVESWGSENTGTASDLGRQLYARMKELQQHARETGRPQCLLAGGETTVKLCDETRRGKGGRNQEVVLGAVAEDSQPGSWGGLTLLSAGTDGEDGPTPSAGALADHVLAVAVHEAGVNPADFLMTNNAWPFFNKFNGLVNTGPTHTNVMDVQVGLAHP